MQLSGGGARAERPWTLLLGPGDGLAGLAPLLRCVAGSRPAGPGPLATDGGESDGPPDVVEVLEGWAGLFSGFPPSGRLLLDAERLPLEEVGLVRAFLQSRPGWHLHLCGSDPSSPAARRLQPLARAHWEPWPLTVDQLTLLARPPFEPPGPSADPDPAPARSPARARDPAVDIGPVPAHAPVPDPAPAPPQAPAPDGSAPADPPLRGPGIAPHLRREIESILGRPERGAQAARAAVAAPPAPSLDSPAPSLSTPPWFRSQVADLADIAQRLELCMERSRASLAEDADDPPPGCRAALATIEVELLRLIQFTRTLGYIAAPPGSGGGRVRLDAMLAELLDAAGSEQGAPRYLLRCDGELPVQADKALLAQALDALLVLAHGCAGAQGAVRVEARRAEPDEVSVHLAFPAGPLAEIPRERVLEPYALRPILPRLGANALAAAAGILRGQGGALELAHEDENGTEPDLLRWTLRLPLAPGAE